MTVARKIEAIIRVIQGESIELVARSFEVTAADVSRWHESFFDGAEYALIREKIRPRDQEDQRTAILVGLGCHG